MRETVERWVYHPTTVRIITGLILINAIVLGLETWDRAMAVAGPAMMAVNRLILAVFVVEIAAKIYARRHDFFRNGWNLFDFVVVAIGLLPAAGALEVLRALRVLRVLRLMSVVPQMRRVVDALLAAIPGISTVAALLLLIFYVGAVITTNLFGEQFPDWFGSIGASLYSLFQIMTLESWSAGMVRPVMEVYPYAWAFFVPFILVTSFAVLNLFVAIVVDSMAAVHKAEQERAVAAMAETAEAISAAEEARLLARLDTMAQDLTDLRTDMARHLHKATAKGEPKTGS
ncbi:ion transporter [Rhodothalassium salexigens]|uniref:ion transporter n=1 Tax=Rhodothalassium salexigens TaxID=1086 RepID=UPI0019142D64|nr:ion transporter [Rhodothalassium salexigens]MBK5911286.1 ion transporter [Rhodothalassium salexigens]